MKKKNVPKTFMTTIEVCEALLKPEQRRFNREITELNRLNGEMLRLTSPMGFAFAGEVFAPEELKKIAGKNYTGSGLSWPTLHRDLWDRAQALVTSMKESELRLSQVKQYIGLVLAMPWTMQQKRDAFPDYIAALMTDYKDVPRYQTSEQWLGASAPHLLRHYEKVSQTMGILAAGQLIF